MEGGQRTSGFVFFVIVQNENVAGWTSECTSMNQRDGNTHRVRQEVFEAINDLKKSDGNGTSEYTL